MNYIDYLIGLGAGVLVTLIGCWISEARREKKKLAAKKENEIIVSLDSLSDQYCEQHNKLGRLEDKLSSFEARLDKLEKRK